MILILPYQVIAVFLILAFFLEKGACQNQNCPNGITNITAASGHIAYPGSSGDQYGANETKCWKIQVPEFYKGIALFYHALDIEVCDKCECDSLTISYNASDPYGGSDGRGSWSWVNRNVCGKKTPSYLKFIRSVDGDGEKYSTTELNLRFSSDGSVNLKGFNFTFIAKADTSGHSNFLNASDDETIEFNTPKFGIKNYPADYSEQWFLIVPSGRQVQLTFEAFELEQSVNCKNAYVEIREPYFDDGPYDKEIEADYGEILSEPLCGNELPTQIKSSSNMVWVQFMSAKNSATTFKGFKASFKAVGQTNQQSNHCCDCNCAEAAKGSGYTIRQSFTLLFISALLVITSKNSLF